MHREIVLESLNVENGIFLYNILEISYEDLYLRYLIVSINKYIYMYNKWLSLSSPLTYTAGGGISGVSKISVALYMRKYNTFDWLTCIDKSMSG